MATLTEGKNEFDINNDSVSNSGDVPNGPEGAVNELHITQQSRARDNF